MRWILASVLLWAVAAQADEITIGLGAAPSSADPYFHQVSPNTMLAAHVFDTLIDADATLGLRPNLAASWTLEGDRTWRIVLRPNIRFHDGTLFTTADVVYSLCRVLHPSGPTASFQATSRGLESVEIIDEHTMRLRMRIPSPGFLTDLSGLFIISAHSAEAAAVTFNLETACGDIPAPPARAFDGGPMANGTGKYRLTSYTSGDRLTLEPNPNPHGEPARWSRVTMRALPNAGARLAGLLSGELDLIENPSAQDLPTIKARGGLTWAVVPSNRVMYLQPDVERDPSPQVSGPNKLRDPRVREAISLAIDRNALATRLLDGMGVPADRYATPGLFAALESAPPRAYDPARARKLLADAGAEGMVLTISATKDRYLSDAAVAQALGQYLTRVGFKVTVDVMPQNVFFPRRSRREFSLALGGWGYSSEGAANFLRTWLATPEPVRGVGSSNYGGYRSETFNTPLMQALVEMDDTKRTALLQSAERIALADNAIIPLYWETSVWAFKDRYRYTGRADQRTEADALAPKDLP